MTVTRDESTNNVDQRIDNDRMKAVRAGNERPGYTLILSKSAPVSGT
eukprot:CAMPEP_0197825154 /NCGR_PEP_ID=MMETSP1437-20131217/2289_1 /TAXON_ID=49252 ORGANISM="Eucampia antarctica, Strain CCMP1452" /NCGR_SAMPLE_ID=MMETSP1437 /ASSEMBLY_ACC=CAM_ASM_001096 /LENGTH=46 /DNA_ID= /DNA_START= /DNA_END= /DNA_ORIENTATION=